MRGKLEINVILIFAIVILVNIIGKYLFTQVDLTEENRFTLTQPTKVELSEVQDVITVQVLLEGEFPAGFKRLQNGIKDILRQFQRQSPYIDVTYIDPNEGSIEAVNKVREDLSKDGIRPVNLRVNDGTEMQEKLIYPYAIFKYSGREIPVDFLLNNPGLDQEMNLNNSINLLEYKFIDAIKKIRKPLGDYVLFSEGHGELTEDQTKTLEIQLRSSGYLTDRVPFDSTMAISPKVKLLIVARPQEPFSDRDKFIIDQYVMNGGRVLWLVDKLKANLDSMATSSEFIPPNNDLNLDDLFFKYGFRLNSDLVLDLECTRIPQIIGGQGGKPQVELFPWFYHPLVQPSNSHPISKNLDRVNLSFPCSIDTVKTKYEVKKTLLLQSSQYSRTQITPTRLNFEILRYKPDPKKFNRPNQNLGVLLEGKFASLFENNLSEKMSETFEKIGLEFQTVSVPSKMLVVSDGDLAKNFVDGKTGKPQPIGYNKWEKFVFNGNSDFLINSIEYLLDDSGLLQARSKELKLRMLDKVKTETERTKWQLINIFLPLCFLLLFGLGFKFYRDRKYTR